MTKKSADINYISKDLFPKTYNRTMIDDDYIKQLEQENQQLKEDIKNIIKILNKNCDDLEATEEEFESLDRWQNE